MLTEARHSAPSSSRVAELAAASWSAHVPGAVRPCWRRLFERMPVLSGDFRRAVLPLVGGVVFWGCGFASYTAVMGHLGPDTAAANAAAAVVRDLLCCLTDGMAGATVVLVGNELGAGRLARGRLYGNRMGILSILVGAVIAVPLSFLGAFVFHWPAIVVYACTCVDEVGKLPWVLHHFLRYKWVKDLTR